MSTNRTNSISICLLLIIFCSSCVSSPSLNQDVVRETNLSPTYTEILLEPTLTDVPTKVKKITSTIPPATLLSHTSEPSQFEMYTETPQTPPRQVAYFYTIEGASYGFINPYEATNDEVLLFSRLRGGGVWVEFANFVDSIAFFIEGIDGGIELWKSDLSTQNETMLTKLVEAPIGISWSADDQHILLVGEQPEDRYIYRIQDATLESWPYLCDIIARSPKSDRFTTWCRSMNSSKEFAVMEWGGEIWMSTLEPGEILIRASPDEPSGYWDWAWSADGEKVAYFTADGDFVIASASGAVLHTIQGSRNWDLAAPLTRFMPLDNVIEWSANGERILVHMRGGEGKHCPSSTLRGSNAGVYENPPCWQVIDVDTGAIVWSLVDYVDNTSARESKDFLVASISLDGNYLALGSITGTDRELAVIDLQTLEAKWVSRTVFPDALRWGRQ